MITKIGLICGEILELLEQRQGMVAFSDVQSQIKEPHELVLMGLGSLLCNGQVYILESPSTGAYRNNGNKDSGKDEAVIFDIIVGGKLAQECHGRIKHMTEHVNNVADKILTLLEGCGDLLGLQTIERHVNEHRDVILMALGCLIREGYVKGVAGSHEIFIFRLPKETANKELFCFI